MRIYGARSPQDGTPFVGLGPVPNHGRNGRTRRAVIDLRPMHGYGAPCLRRSIHPQVWQAPEETVPVRVEVVDAGVVAGAGDAEPDRSDRLLVPDDLGLLNQELVARGRVELALLLLVELVVLLVAIS